MTCTNGTLPNTYELASQLGQTLARHGQFVATAESCTGGGIAQAITAVAGSSGWFEYGVVTYSNAVKTKLLGVSEELLNRNGAVSEPVVHAMVSGLLRDSGADLGLAVSGIAGPGGAVPGKPVGTICFGWGGIEGIQTSTERFDGDREQVRQQSVCYALERLIDYASKKNTV